MSISSLTQPPDASFQPPDATFSIFQECQSSESEVLVWVSPSHSSSTRDLEKPILALPLHWIGPINICLSEAPWMAWVKIPLTHSIEYSRLSTKRDGWNKRDGRKILQDLGPKIHSQPLFFKFKWNFGIFLLYLS